MSFRTTIARRLLSLGRLVQSLALMVMKPDDLVEFGRQMYARPHNVAEWASDPVVGPGLRPEELALIEQLPTKSGKLLLLDVGGGREAIPLARAGFLVTGVDFIPGMVEQAKANAEKAGVRLEGLVQEISGLDVAPESYDVVWLSAAMYSSVPTRRRRIAMLKRIHRALHPAATFSANFTGVATSRLVGAARGSNAPLPCSPSAISPTSQGICSGWTTNLFTAFGPKRNCAQSSRRAVSASPISTSAIQSHAARQRW